MNRLIVGSIALLLTAATAGAQEKDRKRSVEQLGSATGAQLEQLKTDLVAGGMPAHAALKSGPESTAAVRAELRKVIRAQRDAAARASGLVMHEWGAVSYAQGLDDDAKIDMVSEDTSDLPEFAQVWSKLAKRPLPGGGPGVKIEIVKKPIVYFYSDRPETVTFSVACPHGLFTQWFPAASRVLPNPGSLDERAALETGGAMLSWRDFDLRPAGAPALQPVPENAWWWPICRATDSTPINVDGVWEKFLFYRGLLADAPPLVKVDGGAKQTYTLTNTAGKEPVRHLLMIHIAGGKAVTRYVPSLAAGQTVTVELALGADAQDAKPTAEQARAAFAETLEEEGLFPKEAAGMTKIWRKDWFEAAGVRLIYLNPPAATAALLPVTVDPRPAQSVRTLVMAVECLRDSRENVVKQMVEQLGDGAYAAREAAQKQLILLGKRAEPALRAALKKTDDEEVRGRITVILQKLDPRAKAEAAEKSKSDDASPEQ